MILTLAGCSSETRSAGDNALFAIPGWSWIAAAVVVALLAVLGWRWLRMRTGPKDAFVPVPQDPPEPPVYTESVLRYLQVSRIDALTEAGFRKFEVVASEPDILDVVASAQPTFVRLAAVDLVNEAPTVVELEPMLGTGELTATIEPFLGQPDLRLISVNLCAPEGAMESWVHHVIRVRHGLCEAVTCWAGTHRGREVETSRHVTWRPLTTAQVAFELEIEEESKDEPSTRRRQIQRFEIPSAGGARRLAD